jgi:hypothetical protein
MLNLGKHQAAILMRAKAICNWTPKALDQIDETYNVALSTPLSKATLLYWKARYHVTLENCPMAMGTSYNYTMYAPYNKLYFTITEIKSI